MPIDFSLLQAQPTPKQGAIATLPAVQNSGLDSLASGLMSGLKQGQEMAAQRQQMSQQATLFNEHEQDRQGNIADSNNLRTAAAQGLNQYKQELMNQGKVADALEIDKKLADTQKVYQDINKTGLDNGQNLAMQNGHMAAAIEGATQPDPVNPGKRIPLSPDQRQQAWSSYLNNFPPTLRKMMPQVFDEPTSMALHITGMSAMADLQDVTKAKSVGKDRATTPIELANDYVSQTRDALDSALASKDVSKIAIAQQNYDRAVGAANNLVAGKGSKSSPLTETQNTISDLRTQIAQSKAAGTDTKDLESNLQQQEAYALKLSGQKPPSNDTSLNITKQLGAEGSKYYFKLQDGKSQSGAMLGEAGTALSILKDVPDGFTGPVTGYFTGKLSVQGQELNKIFATLPVMLMNQLHIPATMMRSFQMQKQLNSMSANMGMYKEAANFILQDFKYTAAKAMHSNWSEQEALIREATGADSSQYKTWLKDNPDPLSMATEPNFADLYKKDPRFASMHLESTATPADVNTLVQQTKGPNPVNIQAPVTKVLNGVTYINQNGKWYTQ